MGKSLGGLGYLRWQGTLGSLDQLTFPSPAFLFQGFDVTRDSGAVNASSRESSDRRIFFSGPSRLCLVDRLSLGLPSPWVALGRAGEVGMLVAKLQAK